MLDKLFFRTRDNGAIVFRVDTENRQRRLELKQLAMINIRNGEIKSQGQQDITPDEMHQIAEWITARQTLLAEREIQDVERLIDDISRTAQWAQSKADSDKLENVSDRLMMAMHDLRSVLVKRKLDQIDS